MLVPIVPLSDALAATAADESESEDKRRFDYGWLRAYGSAGLVWALLLPPHARSLVGAQPGVTSATLIGAPFATAQSKFLGSAVCSCCVQPLS